MQQKGKKNFIATLLRDVFVGGDGYETVKGERTPFPFAVIGIAVVTTALFLIIIFSLGRISELSSEIASMKKEMVTLSEKEDKLRGDLGHKYSFREIGSAAAELGLADDGGNLIILDD